MHGIKVLQVIHGFPPYYMAGSEVYTYKLSKALAKRADVRVFSRIENPYLPPYTVSTEEYEGIPVTRVNKNQRDYLYTDKYLDKRIDAIFASELDAFQPDVVHVGHLSHLSTAFIDIIKARNIPIVFTLHDFWMMCLRGQLITPEMEVCLGPSVDKCSKCMGYYFYDNRQAKHLVKSWAAHFKRINNLVDMFIAPSRFLMDMYASYGIPRDKLRYMDYGFDKAPFAAIARTRSERIRFGFTGRIIPVKGIDLLIDAMRRLDPKKAELHVFGEDGSKYLKDLAKGQQNVFMEGGYHNDHIAKVFQKVDVLVVPSSWYENSPLVIHEAFMAKIPVITTNIGGMAELVQNGKNGLLFEHKNVVSLTTQMQRIIDDPSLLDTLTQPVTPVRSIEQDADEFIAIYEQLIGGRGHAPAKTD
ncbi:MAG: glycosyltransferase family 4 protein, partial [Candidatus Lokiarchaeota archaeon]|nr:glycosyltransferase family 4 protein [Candidatus Lokiarchaeota archaeon]